MPEYLVFHLYGPMASWGDVAVGEYRNTDDSPSRSAIFGLLAAGLGIRRDEEERIEALSASYKMAVRVDAHGARLQDYHTTQVPPESSRVKKGSPFFTRKDELETDPTRLNTILSTRSYVCNGAWTVYIWNVMETPPYSLGELVGALNAPKFVPYLGRKSCPLAMPMSARVVTGNSLADVVAMTPIPEGGLMEPLSLNVDTAPVLWEDDMNTGLVKNQTIMRRDLVTSRRRWQFGNRAEHRGTVTMRGDGSCT